MTTPPTPNSSGGEASHTGSGQPGRAARIVKEVNSPAVDDPIHPALLPGIGVERTNHTFGVNVPVFAVAAVMVVAVLAWGVLAPDHLSRVSGQAFDFTVTEMGWFFNIIMMGVFGFMMWVGFGPYRRIRLGQDDEAPEFSRMSWIAMLFSAGFGIGLLFYGPLEPLSHFLTLPPAYEHLEPGSQEAMNAAMIQTVHNQGPVAWSVYAVVGGAVAYSAYRKGRAPLMSSLLEPLFGRSTQGPVGAVIDIAAILVTLFGTAVSLGIGALQIGRGVEIVAGIGELGNAALVGIIAVLAAAFIISAVSGVKRGIRILSNINIVLAAVLALFVFVAGPTVLILTLIPSVGANYVGELPTMLGQSLTTSEDAEAWMAAWTTFYWAWWISWSPFVGLFIAKISRGRTLREYVCGTVLVPSVLVLVWFTVFGGSTMQAEADGAGISELPSSQDTLFGLLDQFPMATVTSVLAMVCILIYFVTSADSASIVMGGMAERGDEEPRKWNTTVWGLLLAAIAAVLLVGGGDVALNGLQSMMMVTALPFGVVVILIVIAWQKDLMRDPVVLRRRYASEALQQGVRQGIEEHGDDFVIGVVSTEPDEGAGAWLDTDDPRLSDWYDPAEEAAPAAGEHGTAEPATEATGEPGEEPLEPARR